MYYYYCRDGFNECIHSYSCTHAHTHSHSHTIQHIGGYDTSRTDAHANIAFSAVAASESFASQFRKICMTAEQNSKIGNV